MTARPRIAIIGTGPAGLYAVQHLLGPFAPAVEIDLFERLPVPGGLVRYGVAPDHPEKKLIGERLFRLLLSRPELRLFANVEIGVHVSTAELSAWYDAVIYACGAQGDARLGIAGEDLPGSAAARDFIGWYNGHPDQSRLDFDLSGERAVIIGNGNVALDVARILALPHEELAQTDIAPHALLALYDSQITEIVIAARRGWAQSAFNAPEFEELLHLDDVEIAVSGVSAEEAIDTETTGFSQRLKNNTLRQMLARRVAKPRRRILLQYLASPLRLEGKDRVQTAVFGRNRSMGDGRVEPAGEEFTLNTSLVLRAAGFYGCAIPGMPFDTRRGVIPSLQGRVLADGVALPGSYVTGWLKRGPSGIIGTNKKCAGETVEALFDDLAAAPATRRPDAAWVAHEITRRQPEIIGLSDWLAIDRAEKQAGFGTGRPRVKFTDTAAMLAQASRGELVTA